MFVSLGVYDILKNCFNKNYNLIEGGAFHKDPKEWLNDKDTYLLIFKDNTEYRYVYEWFVQQPEIKIVYQGPAAINSNYRNNGPRIFILVFEKACEKQVLAQDVETMEKTPEGITLSCLMMEDNIASHVATIEMQEALTQTLESQ